MIENAYLRPYLGDTQLAITLAFLGVLAIVFLKGFREAIGLAQLATVPYLLLNLVAIGRGVLEISNRPESIREWHAVCFCMVTGPCS